MSVRKEMILAVLALCVAAAACGAHGGNGGGCTPGTSVPCTCPGGAAGIQVCLPSGAWEGCACADAGMDGPPPDQGIDVPGPGLGQPGAACTRPGDCASGICLPAMRCSRACSRNEECPAAGWTCSALPGLGMVCACTPRGTETCNGQDDDCNGVVDDGATCPTGTCVAGRCEDSCPAERRCGDRCVDLATDNANCGRCGSICGGGTTCTAGSCICPTAAPVACAGRCVNTSTDSANCGSCGTVCSAGRPCAGGRCGCPPAMPTTCPSGCVDLTSDPDNCGACGYRCASGTTCRSSACVSRPGMCPSTCYSSYDCEPCWGTGDPRIGSYCCTSGLCLYTSAMTCGGTVDSGVNVGFDGVGGDDGGGDVGLEL